MRRRWRIIPNHQLLITLNTTLESYELEKPRIWQNYDAYLLVSEYKCSFRFELINFLNFVYELILLLPYLLLPILVINYG